MKSYVSFLSILGFATLLFSFVHRETVVEKYCAVRAEKYCTYTAYFAGEQYVASGSNCGEAKLDLYKQLCKAGWDNPNCQYVD